MWLSNIIDLFLYKSVFQFCFGEVGTYEFCKLLLLKNAIKMILYHLQHINKIQIKIFQVKNYIVKLQQQYQPFPFICLCYGRIVLVADGTGLGTGFMW